MKIIFIGSSSCIPDVGHEASSLLINGKHLVDTGWCSVLKMREYGLNPLELESIILTHLHQDHYLGLPHLLFYLGLQKCQCSNATPLRIIGPNKHIQAVVKAALAFLQISRFPELNLNLEIVPLSAGDNHETSKLQLHTCAVSHVSGTNILEQALAYKFTEMTTGSSFIYTGDTSFYPPIAKFAKNISLLIHDVAHTSSEDAAKIGRMANVKRLYLIHYPIDRGVHLLRAARKAFPDCFLAKEGETLYC